MIEETVPEEKRYHVICNSLGGYDIILEEQYNNQGDIRFTGTYDECKDMLRVERDS